jgi:hypothetical protein
MTTKVGSSDPVSVPGMIAPIAARRDYGADRGISGIPFEIIGKPRVALTGSRTAQLQSRPDMRSVPQVV